MSYLETTTGGLLRFPRFLHAIESAISGEQVHRAAASRPSLLSPSVQLDDVWICLVTAAVILLARIWLQSTYLPKLFRRYPTKLVPKLCEDLCYSIYYIFAFAFFCVLVLPNISWGTDLLSNSAHVVEDLVAPFPPDMQRVERLYYSLSAGFYISATVFLVFFDTRRSDFAQMLTHHAVTIAMIVMSYLYGYVRVGILTIALHDVGDIFLYSSKLFHNMGVSGVDMALFVCFVITFYFTRLLVYPRLVHAISVETLQTLVRIPSFNRWALFYDTYLPHYAFFVFAMVTLLLLQCFWYSLALRLVINELFHGIKVTDQGDIREDDDDDCDVEPLVPDFSEQAGDVDGADDDIHPEVRDLPKY